MQILHYIFRPLPFDAHSALALFTSIRKYILLFIIYVISYLKVNLDYIHFVE